MIMKENVFLKLVIAALLIVILGGLLGFMYSTLFRPVEVVVEVHSVELGSVEFGPHYNHYTLDIYTYEQFGKYLGREIQTEEDILKYTEEAGYTLVLDEGDAIVLDKDAGCGYYDVLEKEVCYVEQVDVWRDVKLVQVLVRIYN